MIDLIKTFPAVAVLVLRLSLVEGYCWQPGWNPKFTSAPSIAQLNLTSVLVSWEDIVEDKECADQFMVRFWPEHQADKARMTAMLPATVSSVKLSNISPRTMYIYETIAREDKGLLGVDYNISPHARFWTTTRNISAGKFPETVVPEMLDEKEENRLEHEIEEFEAGRAHGNATNTGAIIATDEGFYVLYTVLGLGGLLIVLALVGIGHKVYLRAKRKAEGYELTSDIKRGGGTEEECNSDHNSTSGNGEARSHF